MRYLSFALGLAALGGAAFAQAPVETGGAMRLRYEHADEADLRRDSDALTLRAAAFVSWEPASWLTVLAEGEAGGRLAGRYDDGEGLPQGQPVIPDPTFVGLNRAFAELRPALFARLRMGRQNISLGEERFVGTVAFRQNHQTYDAVRGVLTLPGGASLDASYIDAVQRPLGPRGQDRRLRGEAHLLRATLPLPTGSLSVFHYDLDLAPHTEAAALPGGRSRTLGAELRSQFGRDEWTFSWAGALAQQEDEQTGDRVPYGKVEAIVGFQDLELSYRYERLGGGETAFQTPLGTNHKFQGLADLFLVTPDAGIQDQSFGGTYRLGDWGPLRGFHIKGRYHRFDPAENGRRYGSEVDASLGWRYRGIGVSAERAHYRADAFGPSTTRWWLTASKSF